MAEGTLDTVALQELEQQQQRRLLDTTDNLRSLGVGSVVELPQIVVVGDQSSGKSSVLEAISRVKFPTKNGLCTRFATELVLRTSPEQTIKARILRPGRGSNGNDPGQEPDPFSSSKFGQDELATIIEKARDHMDLGPGKSDFSDNVLKVQITGPDLPQLTLVDLPGYYHAETEEQKEEGMNIVEALARKYMEQKSSIILAVVSAKSEIANQIVLHKAKQFDTDRERTLGIITKPDTLERNSSDESRYLQLAKNEESTHHLKLGWHVLRNRTEAEAGVSNERRDEIEKDFFGSGVWKHLGSSNKGVSGLRDKLSRVLLGHIQQHLPRVIQDIERALKEKRSALAKMGPARATPEEHRRYLMDIAKDFDRLATDAVRGIYTDDAFFHGRHDEGRDGPDHRKLRASIRQLNRAFAIVLCEKGASRVIRFPDGSKPTPLTTACSEFDFQISAQYDCPDPEEVSWAALDAEVEREARAGEGTEFPGSRNPWIAFSQFKKHSSQWPTVADRHIELVVDAARSFAESLLRHVTPDRNTQRMISTEVVYPFFEAKRELLASKLEELLRHYRGEYAGQMDAEFLRRLSHRVANREGGAGAQNPRPSQFDTGGVIYSMLTYYEVSCPARRQFSYSASRHG